MLILLRFFLLSCRTSFAGNKVAEDPNYARPNDLLSLIVSGEKGVSQVSDVKVTQHIPPPLPLQNNDRANNRMTSSDVGISEQFHNFSKEVSAILTCEDLEQTILSEYSDSSSTLQAPVQGWTTSDANAEESKADIDDHASQQLLSLLQKGAGLKDNTQSLNSENGASEKLYVSEGAIFGSALDNSREETAENIHRSGNTLTLETLFGSAFMKELQSIDAPVSIQRGPVGSAKTDFSGQQGISLRVMDDSLFPTSTVGIGSNRSSHESNVLQSQGQQTKLDKIESWLGFNDTETEADQSKHRTDVTSRLGGFDGATRYLLPEEESLITVRDSVNTPNSLFMSDGNSMKGELSQKPIDIVDKLAAFNSAFKDERAMVGQEGPPFGDGPHDPMEPEIPYRNLHARPSSPQFHPQMNNRRAFFHPLDSHPNLNSQMNLMAPEGTIHHDARANYQFPANMMHPPFHQHSTGPAGFGQPPFHHPHTGAVGFELPSHPMLQPQMQMSGNFPPPQVLREFSRVGPPPLHSSNQAAGFMQELNPMQGFPFLQQQPNFGGHGIPLPGKALLLQRPLLLCLIIIIFVSNKWLGKFSRVRIAETSQKLIM